MSDSADALTVRPRLPMGKQVMLGLGALLSMVGIAIVLGVVLITRLSADETELTGQAVPFARAVAAAALDAKGIANDERGFLMTGDASFQHQANARIATARAAFGAAEQAAAADAQERAVERAREGFERWVRSLQAEFATYTRGGRARAMQTALGPGRELRKIYERRLAEAQSLGSTEIRTETTDFSHARSQSLTILFVALVLMLAVGGAIAFWLVRTIAQPLYNLATLLAPSKKSAGS